MGPDKPTAPPPKIDQRAFWNSVATRFWATRHAEIDRLFDGVTQATLEAARATAAERVIDIGCGSGSTVLELARRVGPLGHVLGADLSETSVAAARERITQAAIVQADAIVADVSTHPFTDRFDLAFSRFGVMFFDDPEAAFKNLRRSMNPRGRLALAVFRKGIENPWTVKSLRTVQHLFPPLPSGPPPETSLMFSWADPDWVKNTLESAGFTEIKLTPNDTPANFGRPGQVAEAADLAMYVGVAGRALAGVSDEVRKAVRSGLEAFFAEYDGPGGVLVPSATWIVTGYCA